MAIVLCDCLLLTHDVFDEAKASASKATGIPVSNILMAATHTHSGPVTAPLAKSVPDPKYLDHLKQQLAAAVIAANKRLEPARLAWAVGSEPNEVHNRRWFIKPEGAITNPFGQLDEKVRTNPPQGSDVILRPAGPTDPTVSVLSLQTHSGEPLALLANYSLHYVGNIPPGQLSADYFGEFARQIAERFQANDSFVGILSNGASGDINNVPFTKPRQSAAPFERIREVAGRLVDITEQALAQSEYQDQATLDIRERTLTLAVRRPDAAELQRAEQTLAAAVDPKLLTTDEVYAYETIELAKWPQTVEVPLQVIRIGKLAIVALPCEAFAEIGLEIKRHSPLESTFIIGLANGYNGYLPTPGQHDFGGYETWRSRWSYLEREASVKISAAVVEMLGEVAAAENSDSAAIALPETHHALYFVVPKNERTFDEAIRAELGVQGPHKTHWPQRHRFRFKHGYLAWLTLAEAKSIGENPAIREVAPYLPYDVVEGARPRGIVRNYLDVCISPNDWETPVAPHTFRETEELLAAWTKRFASDPAVSIALGKEPHVIRVTITGVKPDPAIADHIRQSGQVQIMRWSQDPVESPQSE